MKKITSIRMSNGTLSVFNPAAIIALVLCIFVGWAAESSSSFLGKAVLMVYAWCSPYFPFSTIEAHARHSLHPAAVRGELLVLWTICPVMWGVVVMISKRKAVQLRIGPLEKHLRYIFFYTLVMLVAFLNILLFVSDMHICSGCESQTIVLGGIFKWGYFWIIGYAAGQIIAVIKQRGE